MIGVIWFVFSCLCFLFGIYKVAFTLYAIYRQRQASKEFTKICNLVLEFLTNADQLKYRKEILIYMDVLGNFFTDKDDFISSLESRTQTLYETFKHLIPELIQNERERKLKKLL